MVAVYEPNKQSGSLTRPNPNPVYNETPTEVSWNASEQYLGFRVDFSNGKLTEAQSGDRDKTWVGGVFDQWTKGDVWSLDHTLDINEKDGVFTINGTMNETAFEIQVTIDGDEISFNSTLSNVDEDLGGVIKVDGAYDEVKPSQAARGFGDVVNSKPKQDDVTKSSDSKTFTWKIQETGTSLEKKP